MTLLMSGPTPSILTPFSAINDEKEEEPLGGYVIVTFKIAKLKATGMDIVFKEILPLS